MTPHNQTSLLSAPPARGAMRVIDVTRTAFRTVQQFDGREWRVVATFKAGDVIIRPDGTPVKVQDASDAELVSAIIRGKWEAEDA